MVVETLLAVGIIWAGLALVVCLLLYAYGEFDAESRPNAPEPRTDGGRETTRER